MTAKELEKQKALTTKLRQWAKARTKLDEIENDRAAALAPLFDAYEKKAEPINAAANEQIDPLLDEMDKIEEEIKAALLAGVRPDGSAALPQLECDRAVAMVTTDKKREIYPADFLRTVHPSQRQTAEFFACLSVLVGKAEKFLDNPTMRRLTRAKLSHSVTITLK